MIFEIDVEVDIEVEIEVEGRDRRTSINEFNGIAHNLLQHSGCLLLYNRCAALACFCARINSYSAVVMNGHGASCQEV
jgi:hypothetical protein